MEKSYGPLLNQIAAVERSCGVESLRVGKLGVWPLIRKFLWQQLSHSERRMLPLPVDSRQFPGAVLEEPQYLYEDGANVQPGGCLFLSRPEEHTDSFSGRAYNRFIDPLISLAKKHGPHLKLEMLTEQGARSVPRFEPTVFVKCSYTPDVQKTECLWISGWDSFARPASRILGFELEEMSFLPAVYQILVHRDLFSKIIARMRPRAVFLACWYYEAAMALAWACRLAKIPCVDVQHGKLGKNHGMYTHWTNIPENGYELIPRFFWSWGEASRANITRWFPQGHEHHVSLVGGNQWLGMWMDGRQPDLSPDSEVFLEGLAQWCRVVLLTLQPLDEPLPEFLLDAMETSPPDCLWLCRLHPLQKARVSEFTQKLRSHRIDRFEMEFATELPLYALLRKSTHHVTGFSSVCYEALHFGLRTAIFHSVGLETYTEELASGDFAPTDGVDALLNYVCHVQNDLDGRSRAYIEVDTDKALHTFEEILRRGESPAFQIPDELWVPGCAATSNER